MAAEQYAAAAKSHQSCPTLWDSIDGSPPSSPVPGIPQARTLEYSINPCNTCILKMAKTVNFMLFVFYHNLNFLKKFKKREILPFATNINEPGGPFAK